MAKILCVCISKERKTCSQNIHECEADLQGLVGDVHYGMGGRKQVSLLPYEKVKEYFEQSEEEFRYGRFGENLLVEVKLIYPSIDPVVIKALKRL